VGTPADAAARVIASDARFAGVLPLLPDLTGQAAWYEAWESPDGYTVKITLGWGDCQAGCIERHVFLFEVAPDGVFGPPIEEGDPLSGDLPLPSGSGEAPIDVALVAGPTCPVERVPPDPACAPFPVAGAEVVVRDATGREVTRLLTNADGHAHTSLPTGTYVFAPGAVEGLLGTPAPVAGSVLGPGGVRLTLDYDTGIR
jgi:hypothetical protein